MIEIKCGYDVVSVLEEFYVKMKFEVKFFVNNVAFIDNKSTVMFFR